MALGRKPKYQKPRMISVYLDDKDLMFIDDHRGKMSRGAFLIECAYSVRPNHDRIRKTQEQLNDNQKEIYELKRWLMFERSKIKTEPKPEINFANEPFLIQFYNDKIKNNLYRIGIGQINYKSLFDRNKELLIDYFTNPNELQNWIIVHHKNNGNSKKVNK